MSALLRRGASGVVTTLGADGAAWATATEAASASVRSAGTHASYPDRAAVRALLGWS
ncbi:MAG: hypothetical protein M3Z25_21465 [Actinomycetota bacterium]|nr:hypothetical protein [Actinomycetota bacterium]